MLEEIDSGDTAREIIVVQNRRQALVRLVALDRGIKRLADTRSVGGVR
jgi:hypothetical protein